ncbi:MAG: DTW domain-containing protein [Alphaproteobacteria bacterium]|nr:DTW domain-containing protein [Alphaproteobacteria bacterium]
MPEGVEGGARGAGDGHTQDTACPKCRKPPGLCVCSAIEPIDNKIFVLILQHPQEQDRELGSAWIAHRQLKNSRLVVGLSWKGLAAIIGRPVDPRKWGVLYLGSAKLAHTKIMGEAREHPLVAVSARGTALADQAAVLGALEGIILLDGNWSQAKALWWRNPWLLKLRRLILAPDFRSLYGKLRKEPRAESISTIEAAALCLAQLAQNPEIITRVTRPFVLLLRNYKDLRRSV